MYEAFYGLTANPFSSTSNPKFPSLSENHQDGLVRLLYSIKKKKGLIILIGEIGTGKTALLNSLVGKLDKKTRVAFILNSKLDLIDIFRYAFYEWDIEISNTAKDEFLIQLKYFLLDCEEKGENVVLIIDEAQNLSNDTLKDLISLARFGNKKENLIQIILSGQIDLVDKLNTLELNHTKQSVEMIYRLLPLNYDETQAYIEKSLIASGAQYPIFTPEAIEEIYTYSKGIPRVISMIAELALLFGFTDQQPEIGRRIIARAAENLDFYDSSQSMEPEARQERPQVDSSRSVAGLPWVRKRLVQRSFWHPVIAVAAGMVVGMLAFIVSSHVDHSFMQGFTTELSPLRGPVQSLPEHPLPPTSEPTMPNMTGHTVAGSGPRSKQAADQATSNQQDQAVASTNLLVSEQTIQKAVPLPTGLPLGATEQDARASLDVVARAENELSAPPAPHPAKHKQGKWPVPPDKTKVLQEEKDQVQEKVPGLADSNVSPNDIRDITLHAKALSTQGRDAEAASLYQRALALQEQTLGPEHPSVVSSLNNLAGLYYVRGSYAEAALLYRRILAIDEKLFGPEHPNMATSLNNLAVLYETQGRYGEAEPLYQRALAIKERALGPDHLSLATSLSNLAVLYHVQGRYAEAEPLYQRALAMDEKRLGPEHPDIATVLENYAALLRKTHREAEAEGLEARVQEIRTIHTR